MSVNGSAHHGLYRASPDLTRAVLALAGTNWEPREDAPSTWAELRVFRPEDRLPVYSGACETSIFGCPSVNYAARAWHDRTHIKLWVGFAVDEECRVAEHQLRDLRGMGLPESDVEAVRLDIVGSVLYNQHYGSFPLNQAAFVASCFAVGIDAALLAGPW